MFRHLTTFESADNKIGIIGQGKSTSLSPVDLEKQPRPPLGNPKKRSWDQDGCEQCSVGSHHRDMMGIVQKGLLHSWLFSCERRAPGRLGCCMAWGKAWAWHLRADNCLLLLLRLLWLVGHSQDCAEGLTNLAPRFEENHWSTKYTLCLIIFKIPWENVNMTLKRVGG